MRLKKQIAMTQIPNVNGPGMVYIVTKTINTVAVEIGDALTKEKVQRLMSERITVTITGKK